MKLSNVEVTQPTTQEELAEIGTLFRNYALWLNVDLCFQDFEAEVAALPGCYAPPRGRLLLAKTNDQANIQTHNLAIGCVGLRPLESDVCEMKRLWVEPAFTGMGLGRYLAEAIIEAGAELGYRVMRLDTIPERLEAAQHIYQSLGFKEIPHYYANPLDGVVMYERDLTSGGTA